MRDLIRRLSGEGRTIFLSTHNLNEAEELCHRIAVIKTKLLALDTGKNLKNRFFSRQVVVRMENISDALQQTLLHLSFIKTVEASGDRLIIDMDEPEKNRPELVQAIVNAGGRLLDVFENKQPLEDVYLKLVHGDNGNEP